MVLKTIDLETTNLTLEELLAELDADTELLLVRGDSPVAKVAPVEPAKPTTTLKQRTLGLHAGGAWMSDDFNEELPMSFWLGGQE